MNSLTKLVVASGAAAALMLGTAGVVVAAGVAGKGPTSVLSGLVEDGTLTQEQADKVGAAFEEHREQMREQMEKRHEEVQQIITSTLGISETELREARENGTTLDELAGDKADQLKAALVAHMKQGADQAVADGKITQEQADKMKENADEFVSKMMAGERPGKGMGRGPGGPGGPGMGGPGMGGPFGPGANGGSDASQSS